MMKNDGCIFLYKICSKFLGYFTRHFFQYVYIFIGFWLSCSGGFWLLNPFAKICSDSFNVLFSCSLCRLHCYASRCMFSLY